MKHTYLSDYTPPDFQVPTVELDVVLDPASTTVRSTMTVKRSNQNTRAPLKLDGEHLELEAIFIDGSKLGKDDYQFGDNQLRIENVPDDFILQIENKIRPKDNTSFTGLYTSGEILCTQCEAEGFRRITYFPDRPDILSCYTVRISGDRKKYPVLLSNGDLTESGLSDNNSHFAVWKDPYPKPCYLFAMVAGNLSVLQDEFVTQSGRKVQLEFYAPEQDLHKCHYGMDCLKRAMQWDEEVYGREYDLNRYMLVAVDEFNMGAMENKGLNIFNSKYVYAKPESATDQDYEAIESVIAHEYFHNWSGNRVTLRDWFQLSLKEGFTIFRDQQFSADMGSADVKRINDANMIKIHQFREDASPNAHPVQPDSYLTINNFYTLTVYNKGAELIRMLHTMIGADAFRRGTDLYFKQNDGKAVTIEELISALENESNLDLKQFRLWYSRSGTPTLRINQSHDPKKETFTLSIEQCPAANGAEGNNSSPLHIPAKLALLDRKGGKHVLQLDPDTPAVKDEMVLHLRQRKESFTFLGIKDKPVPSLLRGFSAPVKMDIDLTEDELKFIAVNDDDACTQWDAVQRLAMKEIHGLIELYQKGSTYTVGGQFIRTFGAILSFDIEDAEFKARLLRMPTELQIAQSVGVVDPDAIHKARKELLHSLGRTYAENFLDQYRIPIPSGTKAYDAAVAGYRSLKNLCLLYLTETENEEGEELAYEQFYSSKNMTDQIAALEALASSYSPKRNEVLDQFYRQWRDDTLVIDKWFRIQATSSRGDTLQNVKQLMRHSSFSIKVPNRVYSLVGSFCGANPYCFHAPDGSGYAFLTDCISELDRINPQLAARLATMFSDILKFKPELQKLMLEQIQSISDTRHLSIDLTEIVEKILSAVDTHI